MSFRKYIKKGICNISISLSKYCVKKKSKKKKLFSIFFLQNYKNKKQTRKQCDIVATNIKN